MSKTIKAIYEKGVFKPLTKIEMKEHTKLTIILPDESNHPTLQAGSLDGIIDIAKDCSDSDLSIHHDTYLYGAGSG